eukprot:scaffold33341_cov26-Cyclotella_meneghiniana.AAC.1
MAATSSPRLLGTRSSRLWHCRKEVSRVRILVTDRNSMTLTVIRTLVRLATVLLAIADALDIRPMATSLVPTGSVP